MKKSLQPKVEIAMFRSFLFAIFKGMRENFVKKPKNEKIDLLLNGMKYSPENLPGLYT